MNILFLMTDEHRPDVTGYEGNDVIRTPNLDRLAETGVVFRNAYTPSPVCVPARQCMAVGQLPKTCGVEVYGQDLPPFAPTFPRQFSRYAYRTAVSGKLHHMGPDQMQGWQVRINGDTSVADQYIEREKPLDFGGVRSVKWSDAKETLRAGIGRGPCQVKDESTIDGTLDFIQSHFLDPYYDRQMPQVPLLLKVSLIQPHYPYFIDADRFNYYLNRVEPYLEDPIIDHPSNSEHRVRVGEDALPRDIQRATAAYYGMIDNVDSMFGQVMDALEQAGQDLDDWCIIYTSDHGEMLGEHGIWEKKSFYEASARVPLIIRWPKRFQGGRVVDENVNLCDLFATLCDLAGIPTPDGLDSRSLVPLLEGDSSNWDDESVSQLFGSRVMIKRGALKYQYYGEDMPELLFDLDADPSENTDYLDDPAYADAVAAFRQRRGELGFGPDADPDYVSAGY